MIESASAKDVQGWRWKHFTPAEMACKCCGRVKADEIFMDRLERLREAYAAPLEVTSGYRCPAHNAAVSSTGADGPHTTGKAADLRVSGGKAFHVVTSALFLGFNGIGLAQKGQHESRFVHVDTLENGPGCPRPTVWTY